MTEGKIAKLSGPLVAGEVAVAVIVSATLQDETTSTGDLSAASPAIVIVGDAVAGRIAWRESR